MTPSPLYSIYLRHRLISTDSRRIEAGSIFFALCGELFDGNRFVVTALDSGAAYAVCDSTKAFKETPQGREYIEQGRVIVVDDTLKALQYLAHDHRQSWDFPVVAITGTNGKTTTKELSWRVLAEKFKVHATTGNLNNHIGVPLTILSAPVDTNFAIIEMGASSQGEIAQLCHIANPNFGVITNIGRAHLEGFGGEKGVMLGKGELYDWLAEVGGTAFYRTNDPVLCSMVSQRPTLKTAPYDCSIADGLSSNLVGGYNTYNIAAAAAIGSYFGVSDESIASTIAKYQPDNNRSERMVTSRNRVILDCYNANPSSMTAALDSLVAERTMKETKMAILGDMLELGDFSGVEHRQILEKIGRLTIPDVYLVGEEFTIAFLDIATVLGQDSRTRFTTFLDTAALEAHLSASPISSRLILLKGSRGIGLEKIKGLL